MVAAVGVLAPSTKARSRLLRRELQELFFLVESMDSYGFPFFVPAAVSLKVAGPEETKNLAGRNVPRLIRNPFNDVESGKNPASLSRQFAANANH